MDVQRDILDQKCATPLRVSTDLKLMEAALFREPPFWACAVSAARISLRFERRSGICGFAAPAERAGQ